jgi:hypothetical protein
MPDHTVRYRASARIVYALALVALFQHARDHHDPDFAFGPLDLEQLENEGLTVSGPDLQAVRQVMAGVPGLIPENG